MKKSMIKFAAITLLMLQTQAFAGEKEEVEQAFHSWLESISSGNPDKIVSHYDKDAILLATLAAKPIKTQEERIEYFKNLVVRPKLGAKVDEKYLKLLDEDNAVISGLYRFQFEQDGKPVTIPARYSFVYEKRGGKWLIIDHHSSRVPE